MRCVWVIGHVITLPKYTYLFVHRDVGSLVNSFDSVQKNVNMLCCSFQILPSCIPFVLEVTKPDVVYFF